MMRKEGGKTTGIPCLGTWIVGGIHYCWCSIIFITSEKPLPLIKTPWWAEGIGCRKAAGEQGPSLPKDTEESGSSVRLKAAFCEWTEPLEKCSVLMDSFQKGPRVGAAHSKGAAEGRDQRCRFPAPQPVIRARTEQRSSTYWTKYEVQCHAWVDKKRMIYS